MDRNTSLYMALRATEAAFYEETVRAVAHLALFGWGAYHHDKDGHHWAMVIHGPWTAQESDEIIAITAEDRMLTIEAGDDRTSVPIGHTDSPASLAAAVKWRVQNIAMRAGWDRDKARMLASADRGQ